MKENRINFYLNRLGNEDWICSCDELDLMGEPNKGDLVWLPLDAPDEEREMYVIMQKYISERVRLAISVSHIIGRIE